MSHRLARPAWQALGVIALAAPLWAGPGQEPRLWEPSRPADAKGAGKEVHEMHGSRRWALPVVRGLRTCEPRDPPGVEHVPIVDILRG